MFEPLDLTIAIPARNEEQNLKLCIESIGTDFARHIVIIDSQSTDATSQIASSYDVEVINFAWNGMFPKKRNWYLRNHTPATKWVLFLDADECLTPAFKTEVRKKIMDNQVTGYWLSYSVFFMGAVMKGGYPLRKLALFQVGKGEYEQINEERWSKLDMEIHEHPVLSGRTGVIQSKIDHRDYRGVSHYITKHNEYSDWEARRYSRIIADELLVRNWTWKQKIKYKLMGSIFLGPAYFLGSLIFLGGFRDGSRGFTFAILKMSYFTQIYCKLKESGTSHKK